MLECFSGGGGFGMMLWCSVWRVGGVGCIVWGSVVGGEAVGGWEGGCEVRLGIGFFPNNRYIPIVV